MTQPLISIVLPVYNEAAGIQQTISVLTNYIDAQVENYELIFVDDGSTDQTVELLQNAITNDNRLRLVEFSRNFGHQLAISAGIRYANGAAVIVMDADLQDPPSVIPAMLAKWRAGYQVVYGKRRHRSGETWFKKESAAAFYRLLKTITTVDIPVDTGDFRLMDRQVVNILKQMHETDPFVRGMVSWVGFKQTAVEYDRQERNAGTSKYPLRKMLHLAMNGITSFSNLPLLTLNWLGGGLIALSVLGLIVTSLIGHVTITTWLLTSVGFVGGLILTGLGLIGIYLSRIFDKSRERPLYIVAKTQGFQQTAASQYHMMRKSN